MIVTLDLGLPESDPKSCRSFIAYLPSISFPNTVCFPLSQGQGTKVMKNWEPFVLGPAFAMDNKNGTSCLSWKF